MEKKIILNHDSSEDKITESESADMNLLMLKNEHSLEELKVQAEEFAAGLPEWDLIPPQVVVRRVKRNI